MGDVTYEDITKKYDDVTAVDNLNLEIKDGEFVTLVGPSGCGKSTSLEMAAGLTEPTSGNLYINNEEVSDLPPKDRDIAMVFQNIALFPHMDVYDNISYGLRLRDFEKEEIDRRVEEAAELVQMSGMLDRMPDEMSGGQRQRVAIARAIVRDPEVFLMDEPLANLDAKLRVHMRTKLQELHKQLDATIIYVTHNQEEAMTMSSRIAVMNHGELQQFDAPLTCYYRPTNEFVAGFIGSPSMNFIDGRVTDEGVETDEFSLDVDDGVLGDVETGKRVTVGVRPEDIYLAEGADIEDDQGPVGAADAADMDGQPSAPIDVTTTVLEPVGDDIYVYAEFGDGTGESSVDDGGISGPATDDEGAADEGGPMGESTLLMSMPPIPDMDTDAAEGQRTQVVLDRTMVHLFDGETGDAIVHGLTTESGAGQSRRNRGEPVERTGQSGPSASESNAR
ncbi:carbohydrate ABC transporter ATP-binding protein, cut1 family [Halogeometricum pallidum JCM 14848]|uniref:ABC-type D-xylose/L-arabinose transporter n=1 Tax=Halogeometricum pallidum JCM 14848 TaxID=1227487 RepID=M0CW86_HALPD|nr:ABC transporter ATP-binding protein [Halogeometricum pallidum]ELZ26139.1 carbohydrate ABC transporter ATP-binding protein, cut1 family [Halogeometricum pallidum JCM 14848]